VHRTPVVTNLMRVAGPPLRGSVVAAAGGSALNQPGQHLRPSVEIVRPLVAGGWTADGMSCPLRREHFH